jgi:hypothetical protein
MSHGRLHIGQERGPRGDHGSFLDLSAAYAGSRLLHQFEVEAGGRAHAPHLFQLLEAGAEDATQAPEAGKEGLGDRLDVAARQAAGQDEL